MRRVVHTDLVWPALNGTAGLLWPALNGTAGLHQHRVCSSKHKWPCFCLVTREKAAFQPLFSSSPLLRSLLFLLALLLFSPSVTCVMCNALKTLDCFRLNYNLGVADRLADEHALIALYVNLLQNKPSTWSVGVMLAVPSSTGRHFAVLSCHLVTFSLA